MDVTAGTDIDALVVVVVGVLIPALSSFFSSVGFVSSGVEAGSDASAAEGDVDVMVGVLATDVLSVTLAA